MNISEFAFNLLLIFFPGIICAYMVDMFTIHKERSQFQFVMHAFLLGFASYLIYGLALYSWSPNAVNNITFLNALSGSSTKIPLREILKACGVATGLAVVIIIVNTHKLHFRLFKKLKITKKFGDQDVWGFLMNSPGTEWITVRDLEHNVMYDGWVKAFSDNAREAELLMEDVSVYRNDSGDHLYDVDAQYLSLKRDKISIEIRRTG